MSHDAANAPALSVVIPNHDRADALGATLDSLAHQTISADLYEVILVDDGSTDSSLALVESLRPQLPYSLITLGQSNSGPGAARNLGASVARSVLLLFLDADTIASPQLLSEHLSRQAASGPALVAGARRVWPAACTSEFMRTMYLARPDDDQFTGKPPSFQEVFSSNLSVPRELFVALGGFDETLKAYEDIDFAYRGLKAGLRLLFSSEAVGYHNHPITLDQACLQHRHYQAAAAAFLAKYPELQGQVRHLVDKAPISFTHDRPQLIVRKVARRVLATPPAIRLLKASVRFLEKTWPDQALLSSLYWKILASYQLLGYRDGLRASERARTGREGVIG